MVECSTGEFVMASIARERRSMRNSRTSRTIRTMRSNLHTHNHLQLAVTSQSDVLQWQET